MDRRLNSRVSRFEERVPDDRNAMGGYLSHPYEQFPTIFHNLELFNTYPYLLPCLVAAIMTLFGILFCHIYYTESLLSATIDRNQSEQLSLKSLSHRRSSSIISDADTLVDPSTETLLGKSPQMSHSTSSVDKAEQSWGFWDLMAYKPVQILSVTMFMNSYVPARSDECA